MAHTLAVPLPERHLSCPVFVDTGLMVTRAGGRPAAAPRSSSDAGADHVHALIGEVNASVREAATVVPLALELFRARGRAGTAPPSRSVIAVVQTTVVDK